MKIQILFSILCFALFSCDTGKDELKIIGKIKPLSSNEVETSQLWIGGEVLDRDLCDYDAYKEYLGKLGAKKIRLQKIKLHTMAAGLFFMQFQPTTHLF